MTIRWALAARAVAIFVADWIAAHSRQPAHLEREAHDEREDRRPKHDREGSTAYAWQPRDRGHGVWQARQV